MSVQNSIQLLENIKTNLEEKKASRKSIEDDSPITPWAVADSVHDEVGQVLSDWNPKTQKATPKIDQKLIDKYYKNRDKIVTNLVKRANKLYRENEKWANSIVKAKGDLGLDRLYVWMRHHLAAELKKNYTEIYKLLPRSFSVGKDLSR